MEGKFTIPYPKPEVFEAVTLETTKQVWQHRIHIYPLLHVDYTERGMLRTLQGLKHRSKGFPFPEAVEGINIIKRKIISDVRTINNFSWLPLLAFAVLPFRLKKRIIETYLSGLISVSSMALQYTIGHIYTNTTGFLLDTSFTDVAHETLNVVSTFLREMGIDHLLARETGRICAMIVEYDPAYTLTLQDIMSCVDKQTLLSYPPKEIQRLLTIYEERELRIGNGPLLLEKFNFLRFLPTIFIWPRFKRAFLATVQTIDFSRLGLTDDDRYHVLQYDNYDFLGLPISVREKMWLEANGGVAPMGLEIGGEPSQYPTKAKE